MRIICVFFTSPSFDVYSMRPVDPVSWLAHYLLENKDHKKQIDEKAEPEEIEEK